MPWYQKLSLMKEGEFIWEIVNMMIVIPMGIQTLTFGPIIKNFLNNSAVNAIIFGGVLFLISAFLALRLNVQKDIQDTGTHIPMGGGH